jgi:S1-C subfamily serine protease
MMPMVQFRSPAIRGLELAKLDEDLAWYFKTADGVLVVKAPKSGALPLKSGDVIQKIDGDAVTEPITVLDKLHGRGAERAIRVEVTRQGRKVELQGTIAAARGPAPRTRRIVVDQDRDAP